MSSTRYPLGTDELELARLGFQQEVWGGLTSELLARSGVRRGARVLDLGCGPGLVSAELAARVGNRGVVLAVDESAAWIAHLERQIALHGWTQVRTRCARLQELELEPGRYDVIFARWVFSFVPDPGPLVERLGRALVPGGRFVIQDYNHEGVSLFPESEGFRAVVRATRELYRRAGGDTWVAARTPGLFRRAGLELVELRPHVLCGGPGSPAMRWAGLFFPHFSQRMLEQGLLSPAERELFLREWKEREGDPDALFFSPIVVDALARRPLVEARGPASAGGPGAGGAGVRAGP